VLNRQAVALHVKDSENWDGRTMAEAKDNFMYKEGVDKNLLYPQVFSGWGINDIPGGLPTTKDARKAFDEGDGTFVECLGGACSGKRRPDLFAHFREAHARNQPVVVFQSQTGTNHQSGWLEQYQENYNAIKEAGLWRENDVMLTVNYSGRYPAVPESINGKPADTATGTMFWALQQDW
jgi:hypothetical protein